jgi:hypothetical protein
MDGSKGRIDVEIVGGIEGGIDSSGMDSPVLFWFSCSDCAVLVLFSTVSPLPLFSYPGSPACPVLAVLSDCSVLAVQSWLCCHGGHVLAVLAWLS